VGVQRARSPLLTMLDQERFDHHSSVTWRAARRSPGKGEAYAGAAAEP
jgi:hypothetical protein